MTIHMEKSKSNSHVQNIAEVIHTYIVNILDVNVRKGLLGPGKIEQKQSIMTTTIYSNVQSQQIYWQLCWDVPLEYQQL